MDSEHSCVGAICEKAAKRGNTWTIEHMVPPCVQWAIIIYKVQEVWPYSILLLNEKTFPCELLNEPISKMLTRSQKPRTQGQQSNMPPLRPTHLDTQYAYKLSRLDTRPRRCRGLRIYPKTDLDILHLDSGELSLVDWWLAWAGHHFCTCGRVANPMRCWPSHRMNCDNKNTVHKPCG